MDIDGGKDGKGKEKAMASTVELRRCIVVKGFFCLVLSALVGVGGLTKLTRWANKPRQLGRPAVSLSEATERREGSIGPR